MARHLTVACAALVSFAAVPVWSQQQTAHAPATLSGVVFDSLVTNAPLSGAEVTVDGTEHSALTDSKGRFRIDGVAAGRAIVRFYHASLDSLGFGAAPVAVTVPDSGTASVRLTTPSPVTLRARLCAGQQATSTGVVLGRVRNVDDRAPLPSSRVSASWSEGSIGNAGLTRTERQATATADENGSFATLA